MRFLQRKSSSGSSPGRRSAKGKSSAPSTPEPSFAEGDEDDDTDGEGGAEADDDRKAQEQKEFIERLWARLDVIRAQVEGLRAAERHARELDVHRENAAAQIRDLELIIVLSAMMFCGSALVGPEVDEKLVSQARVAIVVATLVLYMIVALWRRSKLRQRLRAVREAGQKEAARVTASRMQPPGTTESVSAPVASAAAASEASSGGQRKCCCSG